MQGLVAGKVPRLRRISIITVIGTTTILVLASTFPQLTVVLAILAILVYSAPFLFWTYVWQRRPHNPAGPGLWVRELTPELLRAWLEAGRINREDYDRMIRNLDSQG